MIAVFKAIDAAILVACGLVSLGVPVFMAALWWADWWVFEKDAA